MTDDEMPEREAGRGRKRKPRGPRKATPQYLENAALHYLERFATSEENFRRVLMRKVERSARHHGTDRDEGAAVIDGLVMRYRRSGLLDDAAYAQARADSLFRRGTSPRMIRLKLLEKGIGADLVDEALAALAEEAGDPTFAAAVTYARRRRLGPYGDPARRDDARRERELAALARAGFDYDTARTVIEAETPEELEDGIDEGPARP